MRRTAVVVVAVSLLALVAGPSAQATVKHGGCPPVSAGWAAVSFKDAFEKEIQDTLDAGYTVDYLLELFGVADLDALYEEVALPGYLAVDRPTGDGVLCMKEVGFETREPWFSQFVDNMLPV
jgi:hypothetical protein